MRIKVKEIKEIVKQSLCEADKKLVSDTEKSQEKKDKTSSVKENKKVKKLSLKELNQIVSEYKNAK